MFTDNILTIDKSERIVFPLGLMNPNEKRNFSANSNLSGKTITGLQWCDVTEVGSSIYSGGTVFNVVGVAATPYFTITLVNTFGQVVLNGCPLSTFVLSNSSLKKEIRRTDFKLNIDQCFILNLLPGTTFASNAALVINFFYK